ncbi:MAG: hypothetical protein R2752_05825 [Vicinamibacterales bacterium]
MAGKRLLLAAGAVWVVTLGVSAAPRTAPGAQAAGAPAHQGLPVGPIFQTADACMACHNGLTTPGGEDVSIGIQWRATMMANSGRDPYWQAAVRREIMDHPSARAEIEDECSICHMPMATFTARAAGGHGTIFDHLPVGQAATPEALLAADGVSCTACHQITAEKLGTPESFTGGYVIDTTRAADARRIFGPFEIDAGLTTVMRSSAGFQPAQGTHIQSSELCATCHTLFTSALDPSGAAAGRLPEQMPYLEWQASDYPGSRSCQDCHMPVVEAEMPIARVLGQPRAGFRRHEFRGGNFFVTRMLNRYRAELGVVALPQEMDAAAGRAIGHLQEATARVSVGAVTVANRRATFDVTVENLAGHKFPTAYPSRRAWLHVTVRDAGGRVLFESGAFQPSGAIAGNDNDADASAFEPHHDEITSADQVQIFEAILAAADGRVTTGLLTGSHYLKDNRLLPKGFDKAASGPDVAVRGAAAQDDTFRAPGDRVRYRVDIGAATGPVTVEAELWFQPIGYRWAENLRGYDAFETRRFIRYWESMAAESAVRVGTATAASGRPADGPPPGL